MVVRENLQKASEASEEPAEKKIKEEKNDVLINYFNNCFLSTFFKQITSEILCKRFTV